MGVILSHMYICVPVWFYLFPRQNSHTWKLWIDYKTCIKPFANFQPYLSAFLHTSGIKWWLSWQQAHKQQQGFWKTNTYQHNRKSLLSTFSVYKPVWTLVTNANMVHMVHFSPVMNKFPCKLCKRGQIGGFWPLKIRDI